MFSVRSILWRYGRLLYSLLISNFWVLTCKSVRIGNGVFFDHRSSLEGNNLINDDVRLIDTQVAEYSYISPRSILTKVSVGRYVSIGPGCIIGLGVHPLNGPSTSPYIYNSSIFRSRNPDDFSQVVISPDVWIGANVTILGGISVGLGACIGAGSVVTKDVPPFAIVVGAPSRIIRYRFAPERQAELLASKWWLKDPIEVRKIFEEN